MIVLGSDFGVTDPQFGLDISFFAFKLPVYQSVIGWANEEKNVAPISFSEAPGQHKCGHFIKLDNGNYAIQPNNRLKFHEPSFCTKPDAIIQRKIHTHIWSVENNWKWVFEDNENYDYNIEERK